MALREPDIIDEYAKAGGPLPFVGGIAAAFWRGYDDARVRYVPRYVQGSIAARAHRAGRTRSRVEPRLNRSEERERRVKGVLGV
jgi:hypothetical protein